MLKLNSQVIGGFLQYMVIGSSLNWIVLRPYIDVLFKSNNIKIEIHHSFLLFSLNIGLLLRVIEHNNQLLFTKYIRNRYKMWLNIIAITLYALSWVLMAFCSSIPQLVNYLPPIYVGVLGLVIIDPIERILKNDYIDQERHICFLMSGLSFGWLVFGIILTLILNPKLNDVDENLEFNFELACYITGALNFITGITGTLFNMPKIRTAQIDELELSRRKFEMRDYMQASVIRSKFKPLSHLKNKKFYILLIQLYFLYSPSIGSLDYVIKRENKQLVYFLIILTVSIFFGNYVPILFKIPYSIKPIFAVIQIIMMLLVSIFGMCYDNFIGEIIVLGGQFFLFGVLLSFGILLLQILFDTIIDVFPLAFLSISAAVITQYFLLNHFIFQGILIIQFLIVLAGFFFNLFIFSRYQ